jgi:hypothetical protein
MPDSGRDDQVGWNMEESSMTRLASRLLLTAGAAALLALLNVSEAAAHTCGSACNQYARACKAAAKGAGKAALAQCDLDRDLCRDCGDDPNCPDWSPDCNDARVGCRDTAKAARVQAKEACATAGTTCKENCVEPIDRDCVQGCKADQRDCAHLKKKDSIGCKKEDCKNADNRRRCVRTCKRDLNLALEQCSIVEGVCLGETCIGLSP